MNAVLHLMWKEYRVLRGFWIALAIFGLACDGLILLFVPNPQDRIPGLFALAGVLPACFALGAGATLFALEREESTRELLQYLPLTSSRIFVSKISVALSGTLLLTLLLLGVGGGWFAFGESTAARFGEESPLTSAVQVTAVYTFVVLQAMGWSVFFSLRSARPLLAAVLGAVGALSCIGLVNFAAHRGWSSPQGSWVPAFAYVAATVAIWLLDICLGGTWLHGRRVALAPRRKGVRQPTPLARLFWQEWRGSRRLLAALAVLGIILPLLQWADPYSGGVGAIPAVGLVLALFGSCTFLGDQERSQFRFFAERGVSGRSLWLSRQLFWIGSASVLATILFVAHLLMILGLPRLSANSAAWEHVGFVLSWFAVDIGPAGTRPHDGTIHWLTGLSGYIVWLSLAFGAGQIGSMFFRSGLLAAVFGVILAGLLLAWAALMHVLSIGWWWSVAPLGVALFAATWLRADGWVLERRRLSTRLPSLAVLAVPVVALLIAVPTYRIAQIPNFYVPQFWAVTPSPASAEANDAVRRLLAMFQQLSFTSTTSFQSSADDLSSEERKWLTENQSALDAVVEASLRLPADATAETILPLAARTWQQTATAVIRYGQIAEEEGKLDEAWTRYNAALEVARVERRHSAVLGEVWGDALERAALPQLLHWSTRSGQTVERLKTALSAVQQMDATEGTLSEMAWREYQGNLGLIGEIQAEPQRAGAVYEFCKKWAPWEFARARRLLRYVAFIDLRLARSADTTLGSLPPLNGAPDRSREKQLLQTTLLQDLNPIEVAIEARRSTWCYRRATQLALAAECWRLEHGKMPEELDVLAAYLESLRPDPYTGRPFIWFPWGLRRMVRSQNVLAIPAKTPLLYSPGSTSLVGDDLDHLNSLRRHSADEPIPGTNQPRQGGAGASSLAPELQPMGGPAGPGSPPQHLAAGVPNALPYVRGLAFPIPNPAVEDGRPAKP